MTLYNATCDSLATISYNALYLTPFLSSKASALLLISLSVAELRDVHVDRAATAEVEVRFLVTTDRGLKRAAIGTITQELDRLKHYTVVYRFKSNYANTNTLI